MDKIEADVMLMVGGDFTPMALSLEGYEAVLSRARARANDYLDAFERLFLGLKFDAPVQSRLHLPTFLSLLKDAAPDRVKQRARHLVRQYDSILVLYDQIPDKEMLDDVLPSQTASYLVRLNDRREQLRRLIEEIN